MLALLYYPKTNESVTLLSPVVIDYYLYDKNICLYAVLVWLID